MPKQPTCAERIGEHMEGRLTDFRAIAELQDHDRDDDMFLPTRALEMLGEYDAAASESHAEAAAEILSSYPLGVTRYTTFRVDLSTGGPADWLEVVCRHDGSLIAQLDDGPHEVTRIVYHFSDWGDHAERQLDGADFDAAERFARSVVPELVE